MSVAQVDRDHVEGQHLTSPGVNVGADERLFSKVVGGGLVLLGLEQRSFSGLVLAALGGAMLYRGITGNCQLYQALDINTAEHD